MAVPKSSFDHWYENVWPTLVAAGRFEEYRLGQAFIGTLASPLGYPITDPELFYCRNSEEALKMIQENYVDAYR